MADELGMNFNTYQSLELGRLPLTGERAETISELTGVNAVSLHPDASKAPLNQKRGLYSLGDYEQWQKTRKRRQGKRTGYLWRQGFPARYAGQLFGWYDVLFKAAAMQSKKGLKEPNMKRLNAVFQRAGDDLDRLRKDFGLEQITDAILNANPVESSGVSGNFHYTKEIKVPWCPRGWVAR